MLPLLPISYPEPWVCPPNSVRSLDKPFKPWKSLATPDSTLPMMSDALGSSGAAELTSWAWMAGAAVGAAGVGVGAGVGAAFTTAGQSMPMAFQLKADQSWLLTL